MDIILAYFDELYLWNKFSFIVNLRLELPWKSSRRVDAIQISHSIGYSRMSVTFLINEIMRLGEHTQNMARSMLIELPVDHKT